MATLSANMEAKITGTFTSSLDLTTPSEPLSHSKAQAIATGTGANKANQHFSDVRALDNANENLDLAGGLTDAFGTTITFTKIKGILIKNNSIATGEDITLSGSFMENDFLGGASPTVVIGPGSVFFVTAPVDGFLVTAATGDILNVATAADLTYDIILIGEV